VTPDGYPLPAPISVWIVSGPYILVGIAEIFASITSLEYAFTKAPKQMKGFVAAFAQFQTAISAALNFALVAVNVEQKFTWLFGSFAIMAWITGTLFFLTYVVAYCNSLGLGLIYRLQVQELG
jgi:POT family proton-dependent oligopeptide transporter